MNQGHLATLLLHTTIMQMLYNSDNFAVVQFDFAPMQNAAERAVSGASPVDLRRGGYEIVDKSVRREIFIEGAAFKSSSIPVRRLKRALTPSSRVLRIWLSNRWSCTERLFPRLILASVLTVRAFVAARAAKTAAQPKLFLAGCAPNSAP
jgi:Protein of unknown function (DUF3567)